MSAPPPTVNVTICACEEDHVAAITTIYAHHVLHGLASFEIEPPSENDMGAAAPRYRQPQLSLSRRRVCRRGGRLRLRVALPPAAGLPPYRRKLGLPTPGLGWSWYRPTADVGA